MARMSDLFDAHPYQDRYPVQRGLPEQGRPKAEILMHETWAYRGDDPIFKKNFSRLDMYWKLRDAYYGVADQLGACPERFTALGQ